MVVEGDEGFAVFGERLDGGDAEGVPAVEGVLWRLKVIEGGRVDEGWCWRAVKAEGGLWLKVKAKTEVAITGGCWLV